MAEAPAESFITPFEDSRRWRHIERRPGDIIISTPPKSGTTLMQGIVTSLLWPAGDEPGSRGELSPWIDMRLTPIEVLVDQLQAMAHRRYLKTHSPGDCIPFDKRCQYIVVYRDGRDSLVSWGNHRAKMRPQVVDALNDAATKDGVGSAGLGPIARVWDGDYETLYDEWLQACSPVRHLRGWWHRRHAANVLFVHYNDLLADLEGEMRAIADFLDVNPTPEQWPEVVDRCRIANMRAQADASGGLDGVFDGGAHAFFNQGTNGRWQTELTTTQVDRYLAIAQEGLPPDAVRWLEAGSLAIGVRPPGIGESPPSELATGNAHPLARLARQRVSSIDAIAERRVAEAREQGLFDNLALEGKPIPDIDRHRQPGWWANQFVASERNKVRAVELEDQIRAARPAMWRCSTLDEVVGEVQRLNSLVAEYNRKTTLSPVAYVDLDDAIATWQRMQNR